jgi:hypothetical protein
MSTDRDTTRIVRSWLEEGVTALPDRVLDTVLDQLPATPQRRSWWPTRRLTQLNKLILAMGAAAAVLLAAILGYNLLPRQEVGPQPSLKPSAASSPSPSLLPTASPITGPIVGTWATGRTTCAQQLAAIEGAGYSAEQMTSVLVDPTCKNGITRPGAEWASGSQFTLQFLSDGKLLVTDDRYGDSTFTYRPLGDARFEAADDHPGTICLTYGYAIAGDKLTVQIVDHGCPATRPGLADGPLLDQIGLTVLFETSAFTRKP